MRGSALYFLKKISSLEGYDGIITTDLMSVSDFKGLSVPGCPPILVYFHENQLSYPLAPGEAMDYQFGFTDITKEFNRAKKKYKNHIVQYGYLESRKAYKAWLNQGSIVISTSQQENFGMSVIEAVRHGCLPLLPDRLSYPEILPRTFHNDFLYKDQADLIEKLSGLIRDQAKHHDKQKALSRAMGKYAWDRLIHKYDDELENLACG